MVCKGISEAEAEVRRGSTSGRHDQRAAGEYLSGGVEEWRNAAGALGSGLGQVWGRQTSAPSLLM